MKNNKETAVFSYFRNSLLVAKFTLIVYIGVSLLLLSICAIVYFVGGDQEATAATLEVQQAIHEQCNLESYQAESQYYDPYPRTIYSHKLDSNITIYCDFSSGDWECTCGE